MKHSTIVHFLLLFTIGTSLFSLTGCGKGGTVPNIVLPEVITDSVKQDDVQLYIYVTGETRPYKFVDVTARVSGFLDELYFESGSIVNEGDKLAQIERRQYEIAFESAIAELEASKAREALAKSNLDRAKQLIDRGTIALEEYQSALAQHQVALATIEQSKAAVNKVKLDLDYTELIAPIPGKTTQNKVDVGNLVGPGAHMSILTIAQMDPLFVDFEISDRQFADLKQRAGFLGGFNEVTEQISDPNVPALTAEQEPGQPGLPTRNGLSNGAPKPKFDLALISSASDLTAEFSLQGEIVAVISNAINVETGQVKLRGEIHNPLQQGQVFTDYLVYPGQICRVRIPYEMIKGAVLIREEAIQTDLDTKYVLVLKEGDYTPRNPFGMALKDENGNDLVAHGFVVHRRDIKVGKLLDTQQRIVLEGLEPGEQYVVLGTQKARIGSAVTPIDLKAYRQQRTKGTTEDESATKTDE